MSSTQTSAYPAGFLAFAPSRPEPLSYNQLVTRYGRTAFSKACAESKDSPLSVQEILELRESRPEMFAKPHFNR